MSFTAEEYDVLIAAAEAYPAGYANVYAVDLESGDVAGLPGELPEILAAHPGAFC